MPVVSNDYIKLRLKGATPEQARFLLSRSKLFNNESRERQKEELAEREKKLKALPKEKEKELGPAKQKAEKAQKEASDTFTKYKNTIYDDLIARKRSGLKNDIYSYKNPITNEALFSDEEISEYNKYQKNDVEDSYRLETESFELGSVKSGSIDDVYKEIAKARKKENRKLDENNINQVLNFGSEEKMNEMADKFKVDHEYFANLVKKIEQKQVIDKYKAIAKNSETPEHKQMLEDLAENVVSSQYAAERAASEVDSIENDIKNAPRELEFVNEEKKKIEEYEKVLNEVDEQEKTHEPGFMIDDLVAEYQHEIKNFANTSNEEKEMHPDLKENLDFFKIYFESKNIDTTKFRFTNAEKATFEQHNDAITDYRNTQKAYEKTSLVGRFFSHFVPRSWTSYGRMRDTLDDKRKVINEAGISNNMLDKYNSSLDEKEKESAKAENNQAQAGAQVEHKDSVNRRNIGDRVFESIERKQQISQEQRVSEANTMVDEQLKEADPNTNQM